MAKKKGKSNTVPKTAEQKGAESALQQSQRIALEAQRQRTAQSSRGGYRARQLRAGGTSLGQYDMAKFKSDPFPALGGGGGGTPGPAANVNLAGGSGGRGARGGTTPAGKARAKAQAKAKSENRLKTNPNGVNIAEKMEAQAAAKAKAKAAAAAAAAKAKKKKQQKLTDSKGGTTKALGTKAVMS